MRLLLPWALVLAGCASDPGPDPDPAQPCAWQEGAHARQLGADDWRPDGPDALAAEGDALLANPLAAFVISAPDSDRTYYHYGGIPIDAVVQEGCAQASTEQLGEIGLMPGRLELSDFLGSTLRQFRATSMAVISDGSDGGPAHVRVEGVDDRFWLVDYTLTGQAAEGGGSRPLSGPLGATFTVDYVLPPDQPVLEITVTATNTTDASNPLLVGAVLFPSAHTRWVAWGEDELALGGFRLDVGLPWFGMGSADAGYALAIDSAATGFTNVSGANALIDVSQAVSGTFSLGPAGTLGASATMRAWLSVGRHDVHDAVEGLLDVVPSLAGEPVVVRRVRGRVEGADGPVVVEVEADRGDRGWGVLDRLRTDASGAFDVRLPTAWPLRLVARDGLRDASEPVALGDRDEDVVLPLGPSGRLTLSATDGAVSMAAKATLDRSDGGSRVVYVPPGGIEVTLPAGTWTVNLTRGYEHAPFVREVVVGAGQVEAVEGALSRVVDTTGWISVDGHVHTSPSADSDVVPERRFATVAAAGLEVMVQTDHEAIVDLTDDLASSPWAGQLATLLGEEVTASLPEHLNMWGVTVGPEDGPRGAPVRWYGRDIDELYTLMRERGAGLVQLNHPSWMNRIRYDPVTGVPGETDPTRFGLAPGAALWSWEFDAIELLNGFKYIWGDADRPGSDGLFRSWAGFLNLGHRITGVGVSDVHGLDTPGTPRTYVAVPDDALEAFAVTPVLESTLAGRAMISAGAFARVAVGNDTAGFEAGLGDTVSLPGDQVVVRLSVDALPGMRVDRAVVFVNCDAVAEVPAQDPDGVRKLTADVPLTLVEDGWITVAAFGSGDAPRGLETPPAHVPRVLTNPVYVDVDGSGTFEAPGARVCAFAGLTPTR